MKIKIIVLLSIICFSNFLLFAQNVGIGTNAPHPSSKLEIKSDTSGLLMPRIDSPSVRINSPAAGLMVYNLSTNTPSYFNGSTWMNMGCGLFQHLKYTRYFHAGGMNWVIPPGITKIWIEGWTAGGPGQTFVNPNTEIFSAQGGYSGSYLSAAIPVEPGSTLNLLIPDAYGSELTIKRDNALTVWLTRNEFVLFDTSVLLYQFVPGQSGNTASFSFEQLGTNDFRKVIHCGNGGTSFLGGSGGSGTVLSTGLPSGSVLGYTTNWALNGSPPGGGGGSGYPSGGIGGEGLLIIRY